jgi:hypothetical protein
MATAQTGVQASPLLRAGAIAGVVAGIIFAMFEMVMAAIMGDGFFMPLRMIGAIILGEDAMMASYSLVTAAAVGLVVHMMLSVIYGVLFGAIVGFVPALHEGSSRLIALATLFGFALWLVNFYIIAPIAFEWFGMADSMIQFVAHTFFFGTALGLTLLAIGTSRRRS